MDREGWRVFGVCFMLAISCCFRSIVGQEITQEVLSRLEYEPASFLCPGYDPGSAQLSITYNWYKQDSEGDFNPQKQVAYFKSVLGTVTAVNRTKNDLEGRGWLATENGQLTINSARLTDEHWYTCSFPYVGKVMLYVNVLPENVHISLPENVMIAGSQQQIQCTVGRVKPQNATFTWYFSHDVDNSLPGVTQSTQLADGTWKLINTLTYTFTPEDNGKTLVCSVTPGVTGYNPVQDDISLNILYAYLTRISSPDDPVLGTAIEMTCEVQRVGNPAIITQYEWRQNGSVIQDGDYFSGATSNTLIINQLTFENSGSYECKIFNDAGWTEDPDVYDVDIWYPPIVTIGTQDPELVIEGGPVTIPCSAHYYPNTNFSVEWLFGDDMTSVRPWNMQELSYTKSEVDRQDRGNFICRVCNIVGCTSSEPLFLDVQYGPTGTPQLMPDDVTKKVTDTVVFTCETDSLTDQGNPPDLWIYWGKTLNDSFTRNETELRFTAVSITEAGEYWCYVGNAFGHSQTSTGMLDIEALVTVENPTDIQTRSPKYNDPGFFMECTVSGSNIHTIGWHQDGRNIDTEMFSELPLENVIGSFNYDQTHAYNSTIVWIIQDREWTCDNVEDFDGEYKCTGYGAAAGADQNEESAPFNVKVEYEPLWNYSRETELYAELGETNKQLACSVCAHPAVYEYRWSYKDGAPLRDGIAPIGDDSIININSVRETDFMQYKCTAVNSVSRETMENDFIIELMERGPPRDPGSFSVLSNVTSQSLSLTWVPQYHAGYPPQTFNLRYKVAYTSEYTLITGLSDTDQVSSSYTIHNLQPSTQYILQLQAVNQRPITEGNNTSNWVETTGETAGVPRVTLNAVEVEVGSMSVLWHFDQSTRRKRRQTPSLYSSDVNLQILYKAQGAATYTVHPENGMIPASHGTEMIHGDFDPMSTYSVMLNVYEGGLMVPSLQSPPYTAAPPAESSNIAVIAGGVVGGMVVIVILIVVILFFLRRQRMKEKKEPACELNNRRDLKRPFYSPVPNAAQSFETAAPQSTSDPYAEVDMRQPLNRQPQNGTASTRQPLTEKEIDSLYAKPNKKKALYENVDSRGNPVGGKPSPVKDGSDSRLTQEQIEALYAKVNKPGMQKAVADKNSREYYDRKNWEENPYEEVATRRPVRESPYASAEHPYDDVRLPNQQRDAMRTAEDISNPYAEVALPRKKQNPGEVVYADLELHNRRPPSRPPSGATALIHGGDNTVDYATVDFDRTAKLAQRNAQAVGSAYPDEPIYCNEPVSQV